MNRQPAVAVVIAILVQAEAAPAVVDDPQFFRRDAQQRLVEDRHQHLRWGTGGHGEVGGFAADGGPDDQFRVAGQRVVGVDQSGDHCIDGTAVEQRHGIERAFGLDPADLRIVPRQHGVHGAVAGDGDAMTLQLFQRGEGLFVLAADQHIGAFKVGLADLQVVFVHPAGRQCSDDIGAAILEAGNHVGKAAGALYLETQAGAQAKEFEQVSGDAAKMPRAIEIRDRCSGVIDCHTHHRVVLQPLFFGFGQLQLAVGQQLVATSAPAFEDTGAYGRSLSVQGGVHHLHQHPVLVAQGKTEADGFVLAETGHAQAWQVAAIELVVGGNGIADEHVGLAERHGTQGLAG